MPIPTPRPFVPFIHTGLTFLLASCSSTPSLRVDRVMPDSEFADLKKSLLFGPEDVRYLRMSRDVLEPNVDALLAHFAHANHARARPAVASAASAAL